MARLFVGIAVLLVGVGMFIYGLFFGWASGLPNTDPSTQAQYQAWSTAFGILTYVLLGAGALLVYLAIRRMNVEYRKEQSRASAQTHESR
jgi:TRAP-type C4-dicarboxylate transport system permease small subunit